MAPDAPSGARPAPVVLRIKLRYDDVEALVQRFAANVGKSGLFLPTKSLQAVGAEIKFELRLADDKPVIVGLGRVKAARAPDPANPRAAFGMAIELMRVTRESRDVILKMLEHRKALGLPELGIPMPDDIDAARRGDVDTSVKGATGVPDAAATTIDSAPIDLRTPPGSAARPSSDGLAIDFRTPPGSAARPSSSGLVTATPPVPESVPVLTAPRRTTGPLAVAKVQTIAPLAPEPPRKKRPGVNEVLERASGPISALPVTVPGLDDDVDVGAVLARAKILAGDGALDAELEALRDGIAAPIEISVEAASAELAKQLGGPPVTRDRSARWAPPPSVTTPAEVPPAEVPAPDTAADVEPPPVEASPAPPSAEAPPPSAEDAPPSTEAAPIEATPDPSLAERSPVEVTPAPSPVEAAPSEDAIEAAIEAAPEVLVSPESAPILDIEPDPEDDEPSEEVSPEQIADEIHQLSPADYEEVEHTAIGAMPGPPVDEDAPVGYAASPDLEASIDQHLAEAEAEDDLGLAAQLAATPAAVPLGSGDLELPSEEDLARLDEVPADATLDAGADAAYAPAEAYEAVPDDEAVEEIDELEILAEADAADEDLLTSDGEADASGGHAPAPAALDGPPPDLDAYEPDPASEFATEYVQAAAPAYQLPAEEYAAPVPQDVAPVEASAFDEPAAAAYEAPAYDPQAYAAQAYEAPSYEAAAYEAAAYEAAAYEAPAYEASPAEPIYELAPPPPDEPPYAPAHRARAERVEPPLRPSEPPLRPSEPPLRPSELDFVSRLDLSDQFEAAPEVEEPPAPYRRDASFSELDAALGELDPEASAGHALAAFSDEELDESPSRRRYPAPPAPGDLDADSQYTIAGDLPQPTLELGTAPPGQARFARPETPVPGFPPLHAFDASDVIQASPHHTPPPGRAADGYDLETALEALDVDLDDLAAPHAPTELAAATPRATPRAVSEVPPSRQYPRPGSELPPSQPKPRAQRHAAPRRGQPKPKRVETDIPIDFDDDE